MKLWIKMKKTEGKQKISFVGYETISKKLFLATPTKGLTWTNIIFAWAFSQFLWNLMFNFNLIL